MILENFFCLNLYQIFDPQSIEKDYFETLLLARFYQGGAASNRVDLFCCVSKIVVFTV